MMQRLRTKREQDEAGFTLVELLVVIVILGILAAIVVFAVGGITDKGTTNAKATDMSSLQAAEEAEFAASKTIPPVYIGMGALQSGGFLRTASTYNEICLGPGGTDYFVQNTPNGVCATPAGKTGPYVLAP